jgi:hypothetical protein
MKPSLSTKIYLKFIKLITRIVESVLIQMQVNKLWKQMQNDAYNIGIPRICVDDKTGGKMAQHKPTRTKRSGNGSVKK